MVISKSQNLVTWVFQDRSNQDEAILIDAASPERFLTKKQARELVLALAGAFKPGSTVCLHVANDVLYPVLVLAILASGCRWTGTNPAYTAPELSHHFKASETKYIICEQHLAQVCQEALDANGSNAEVIIFEDIVRSEVACGCDSAVSTRHERKPEAKTLRYRKLSELLSIPGTTDLCELTKDVSPEDIAVLMQTSGTTGLPKMAARTHRAMNLEQAAIEQFHSTTRYSTRRLFCTPIFHGFSTPEMVFNALRLGHTAYFMGRFDDSFAQKIHDFNITETFGAPPMFLRLVSHPNARSFLASLKAIYFGGAPLAPELKKRMLDLFEGEKPRIVPVYGMTEGGWFTTLESEETDDTGSLGKPLPGFEMKVVPRPNAELGSGQAVGEILVKGPQLMTGYFNNSTATEESFEDGWLKTGDIGYFKDGKVFLVDRAKDLIKVNGWQVSPAEVENALLEYDGVQDAGVVGVGEDVSEHPVACVVVQDSDVTAEMLKVHLRARLASYKVSMTEICFVDCIPKNPSGKILRNRLKAMLGS
ncbi:acetyl-CoA synthetase-like protein [Hortaea werneckii]|uniref:AMP-dependent synthetase/ligase domain-containing protein n=2 Tax=Hortaea werneckii TaxID=91943 RepID=A0A3M7IJB4_HORWE|nr:acetyl-CoA synthetase-like protein [Hortaea werneckii]OTA23047.1 hypothetical protein BTJ68_14308 [Hortaea werneckii EXF-2000]KAI6830513.1 acetyl-CoA synthetase-like protein [Hortaea werneckii]KAI6926789.1 acetyl-CoA synthetase-like protein [Hortaea werneckii]KAI6933864.1 acetyl-CoA synthetase-like protein [Hortaea werneckii]